MKIAALEVSNLGCIGAEGRVLPIDDIVLLIGPNSTGKSTLLDAYEALFSQGSALPLSKFHNEEPANTPAVAVVLTELTGEDMDKIGVKWVHVDPVYGECVKFRYLWTAPGEKGDKQSWDPSLGQWAAGGAGGIDPLLTSCLPVPLRIRPTDGYDAAQKLIVAQVVAAMKEPASELTCEVAGVQTTLTGLAQQLADAVADELEPTRTALTQKLRAVFPGTDVAIKADAADISLEDLVAKGTHVRVGRSEESVYPLSQQGAGVQRAFIWCALQTLAELGKYKLGKTTMKSDRPRILLVEEPECFLHPPAVRACCDALYDLAAVDGWQVVVCTHSPAFVDVAKPHTTIVRVAADETGTPRMFSTDKAFFDGDEKSVLRMVRSCHPTVNEFFFADHTILVEGETEQVALAMLLPALVPCGQFYAVVNCMGKGNIPLFARILNQFGSPYTAIFDADCPRIQRSGRWEANGMWTVSGRILDAVAERPTHLPPARAVVTVPDFEQRYYGRKLRADKPYTAYKALASDSFQADDKYEALRKLPSGLVSGSGLDFVTSMGDVTALVAAWADATGNASAPEWQTSG